MHRPVTQAGERRPDQETDLAAHQPGIAGRDTAVRQQVAHRDRQSGLEGDAQHGDQKRSDHDEAGRVGEMDHGDQGTEE